MVSKRNIIVGTLVGAFSLMLVISTATHGFAPQKKQPITSNLPIVVLRMDSTTPVDINTAEEYVTAWMDVIGKHGEENTFHLPYDTNAVTERYKIGVHIRGQSTRGNPKKPFAVKMYDYNSAELKKKDYALFGMPKQDKYVLYSACADPALIRNQLSFDLGRDLGHFTPRMRYVELFVKSTNSTDDIYYPQHYHGVYLMSEKIHRGDDWVDVKKMDEKDNSGKAVTGGYIFKVDKWEKGEQDMSAIFTTNYANYIITEPSDEVLTPEKYDYLFNYVTKMEEAIMNANHTASTGEFYTSLFNMSSFVDTFIMQELSKNIDAYRLSSYFYKNRNGVINSGPIWDLDRTYGNQLFGMDATSGWVFNSHAVVDFEAIPKYWVALLNDKNFTTMLKNRWTQLRQPGAPLATSSIMRRIDALSSELESGNAAYRDYNRWGPWYFPFEFWVVESYSLHQVHIVKKWTEKRVEWMDTAIGAM